MGNGRINLEGLFDGNSHEVLVDLEGIGGGGRILLEISYRSFHEIDEGRKWWEVPFISKFIRENGLTSALASIIGSESMPAGQFVQNAFGKLKSFNDARLSKDQNILSENDDHAIDNKSEDQLSYESLASEKESNVSSADTNSTVTQNFDQVDGLEKSNGQLAKLATQFDAAMHSDFWKNFSDVINQNVVQKFGFSASEDLKWDGFELLNKIGLQSKMIAEAGYVESGLATPDTSDIKNGDAFDGAIKIGNIQASLPDIKKTMQEVLRQTDSIFGALIVLAAEKPVSNENWVRKETHDVTTEKVDDVPQPKDSLLTAVTEGVQLDEKKAEMKELFTTAETAMEAWAMLASAVGHPSFIKSEFEKLCFLDNSSTDTQVAIWRDYNRKRLVVAFRGTEQAKWKDLVTDLMLVPTGLNPERIGGDFNQEVQVHSGFLGAYDSVRTRLISLVKLSIGFNDNAEQEHSWKVYVTGHSLGGALATLLALELSSSQLAKRGAISVTMYNFGSPRVGNRRFAEVYNERVKDSWRVVNHRDIIPTVPRLMGYCHVAQPVYLATGGLKNSMENAELLEDGYQIDVAGEYTPDVLVNEFMKGEKELVEKILQTEINLFRSIRDGSALMQHMEDFYYITLLEVSEAASK
uniref:Fungal lipase-type domain-containing protein n=1 Tax=Kalanchoe fedtschenkoi TaxID=63787 RepID=A0A7N0T7Y3_KALFE